MTHRPAERAELGVPATEPPSVGPVLPVEFYDRPVVEVAEDLIGCTVSRGTGRSSTEAGSRSPAGPIPVSPSGVIVETEAYHESEPACHAFVGLTPRTRILFGAPGNAYVFRSYGIHALLNAVCEPEGVGAAVLIRALHPTAGIESMRARRERSAGRPITDRDLCSGPGKLTQALDITLAENGTDLVAGPIRIHSRSDAWREPMVIEDHRIGITKAVELRWRFVAAGDPNVSRPRPGDGIPPRRP